MKRCISPGIVAVTTGLTIVLWGCGGGEPATRESRQAESLRHSDHAGHHHPESTARLDATPVQVRGGNTTCPVMGGAVNRDLYVDHGGKRIYLCCEACVDKVKQNPEKYLKKLEKLGEQPGELIRKELHKEGS